MKEAFVSCQGSWQVSRLPGHLTMTENYCSNIMLVCQENQGPWQMNHQCLANIWLTAIEE
jgi:hypothetical protein